MRDSSAALFFLFFVVLFPGTLLLHRLLLLPLTDHRHAQKNRRPGPLPSCNPDKQCSRYEISLCCGRPHAWWSGACLGDFLFGLEEDLWIGFPRSPAAGRSSIWATLMYWVDRRRFYWGGAGGGKSEEGGCILDGLLPREGLSCGNHRHRCVAGSSGGVIDVRTTGAFGVRSFLH
jgi:hypothetical protein